MVAEPIQALVIQPDDTYVVKTITQDLQTLQGLVGGYIERVNTPHADLWMNEHGKLEGLPINTMATYLWWKLSPEMEAVDTICGTCFVTGGADGHGGMLPVADSVVELYKQMEQIRHEEEDGDSSGAPTPPAGPAP